VNAPPEYAIDTARRAALESPCQKSKRGVALFNRETADLIVRNGGMYRTMIAGTGFNGPPPGFICDGSEACRADCGKFCVHAEVRGIRAAGILDDVGDLELVHVKVVGGLVVDSGPPSCWQCSREVLDVGLRGVWLFEQPVDRTAAPGWRYYTAHDFHCATLMHCGIAGVPA